MARAARWVAGPWQAVLYVWALLHIVGLPLAYLFSPAAPGLGIGGDVVTYISAGQALAARQPLYELGPWADPINYRYHPAVALLFSFGFPNWMVAVWMAFCAYIAGLVAWGNVALDLEQDGDGRDRAPERLSVYAPLALVWSAWLSNVWFGNIAPALVLLAGLVPLFALRRRPYLAGAVLALLALTKPQWGFGLVLLMVQRKWGLLAKTLAAAAIVYAAISGFYAVLVGPQYGLQTLLDYARFLSQASNNYPWQGTEAMFNTFQHRCANLLPLPGLRGSRAASWSNSPSWASAPIVCTARRKPALVWCSSFTWRYVMLDEIQEVMMSGVIVLFVGAGRLSPLGRSWSGPRCWVTVCLKFLIHCVATGIAWLYLRPRRRSVW
jgi:hypothetical protein